MSGVVCQGCVSVAVVDHAIISYHIDPQLLTAMIQTDGIGMALVVGMCAPLKVADIIVGLVTIDMVDILWSKR